MMKGHLLLFLLGFQVATCTTCSRSGRRRRRISGSCSSGKYAYFASLCSTRVSGCVDCPANTHRGDTRHIMTECKDCSAGRNSTPGASFCNGDICSTGRFGTIGSNVCAACSPGHYSGIAQFTCTPCASGRYTSQSGQTRCLGEFCAGGKYGVLGSTQKAAALCDDCAVGKWAAPGSENCTDCPSGKFSPEGTGSCQENSACPKTYYGVSTSPIRDVECHKCVDVSATGRVAVWFSLSVFVVDLLLVVTRCSCYCPAGICMLWPGSWFLALLYCRGPYPSSTMVLVLVIDVICLTPLGCYLSESKWVWNKGTASAVV